MSPSDAGTEGVAYDEGHIPGAILWNAYSDLSDRSYIPVGLVELRILRVCRGFL